MILDENDQPITPQRALVDGYGIAERTLEGVMFVVKNVDGKLVCDGVQTKDQSYFNDFSEKKKKEWCEAAVEHALEFEMTGPDGSDCYWNGEDKPAPRQAIPIKVQKADLSSIFGKKNG